MSVPYKLMDNVAYIDAGDDYSMAITTDGTLYAWGYNEDGQLGLAKTDSTNSKGEAYQSKPAKVMDGIKMVSCGAKYMAFALKENGDLYGWGNNSVFTLFSFSSKISSLTCCSDCHTCVFFYPMH